MKHSKQKTNNYATTSPQNASLTALHRSGLGILLLLWAALLLACGQAPVETQKYPLGTKVWHVAVGGQSNAWGVAGFQPITNQPCGYRLTDDHTAFEPLDPYDSAQAGLVEMPAYRLACVLQAELGGIIIVDTFAKSNTGILGVRKGTATYNELLARTNDSETLALSMGYEFEHLGQFFSHGERDLRDGMSRQDYAGHLTDYANDWLTDTSTNAMLVVVQGSAATQVGGTAEDIQTSSIALAQRDVAISHSQVVISNPTYHLTHHNGGYNVHLNNWGHLRAGEDAAKAFLGREPLDFVEVEQVTATKFNLVMSDEIAIAGNVAYPHLGFHCNNRTILRVSLVPPTEEAYKVRLALDSAPDANTVCSYANYGEDDAPAGPVLPTGIGGKIRARYESSQWLISFETHLL